MCSFFFIFLIFLFLPHSFPLYFLFFLQLTKISSTSFAFLSTIGDNRLNLNLQIEEKKNQTLKSMVSLVNFDKIYSGSMQLY